MVVWLAAVSPAAAQIGPLGAVTGVVQDQTGAVLSGASVDLLNATGVAVQSTFTDGVGTFRFERVASGQYQIRAQYEGFTPASTRVRVTTGRAPGAQKLVLGIAGLTQEITVSNAVANVGAAATNNVDAVSIDTSMLESLPVFDNDFIGTMSRFLDTGSLGSGGVTIVVNGMEVNALNVSASAVQQIRINQDPYSAEYSRPGRGRVEILTKPGEQVYHGDLTTIVRDAHVNARNPFAATKPGAATHVRWVPGRTAREQWQNVVHAVSERRGPRSTGVCSRGWSPGRDSGFVAAVERSCPRVRQRHASGERQEHILDSAQLPVRE